MSFSGKRWLCAAPSESAAAVLAGETGLLPAAVQVLINRGIKDAAAARAFLNPSLDQLASPWLMRGMEQAVVRLMEALERDQKIIIHGDYDADGVTATVIMVETLRALGGRVDFYLPSRFAGGYGLHREALDRFKDSAAGLVVSVDCGISAFTEALHA
ncbi:MAG: DHH family phosphoesterase, partial [Bacillota bacterium]